MKDQTLVTTPVTPSACGGTISPASRRRTKTVTRRSKPPISLSSSKSTALTQVIKSKSNIFTPFPILEREVSKEWTEQSYEITQTTENRPIVETSNSWSSNSAEVTSPAVLPNNLRSSTNSTVSGTHKGVKTRSPQSPDLRLDSQGPVGAEVKAVPEPADNLWRPVSAGRGTHKGVKTCSPTDNVGVKLKEQGREKPGTSQSLKDYEGVKLPTRRNPPRTRHPPARLVIKWHVDNPPPTEYFPALRLEVSNAELYDALHKERYGCTAEIAPSTSTWSLHPSNNIIRNQRRAFLNASHSKTANYGKSDPKNCLIASTKLHRTVKAGQPVVHDSPPLNDRTILSTAESPLHTQNHPDIHTGNNHNKLSPPGHPGPHIPGGKSHLIPSSSDLFCAVGTILPLVGGMSQPTTGEALSRSATPSPSFSGSDNPHKSLPRNRTTLAVQWNMNGYFHNLPDLEMIVDRLRPIALAIQEVHRVTVAQMNATLKQQYKWYVKSGNNVYQSTAVGISADIPAEELDIDTDLPIIGARISWPFPVSIISVYLPNGRIPDLKNCLRGILERIPGPIILLGDVNGHHMAWGSRHNDIRGAVIAELACQYDLTILNDGSPTFSRGVTESSIDISLASAQITNRLLWAVEPDLHSSDHFPISLTLEGTAAPETSRRPKWLFERADWSAFQNGIDERLIATPPESFEDFTELLYTTAAQTIPRTSSNPGRRALRWWNEEIRKAVKLRRKTLRKFRKLRKKLPEGHPDLTKAQAEYTTSRNECRQTIRTAKEASWTEFLDGINEEQKSCELWRRINCLQGKRRAKGMTLKIYGVLTRDPVCIADAFADYFHKLSSIQRYPDSFRNTLRSPEFAIRDFSIPPDRGQDFNLPFTIAELDFALKKAKGKSAGSDEIGYPMLKHLPPNGKLALLEGINREWLNETLPETWRHSLVVAIPKNSGPASDVSSYRPIALTSCLSKITERMVNRRLISYLENNQLLDHRQHAFRSGFGTGTYFAAIGQILEDATKNDEHIEMVSLDLAKAYNRAWTPAVLKKLANWGFSGNLLAFVKNFLNGRTFQVLIGNHRSKIAKEETGVPQGSVLAVTLFLVAMSGVFLVLPKGVFILVYADDILLLVRGKHPKSLRRKLQAAVSAVAKWAKTEGFDIAAEKCARIHICTSNHRPPGKIFINKAPIPTRNNVKILGVTFDRNLSFQTHFKNVKVSCRNRVNMIKCISTKRTRSSRATRKHVTDAVVCSRLLYGIEATCRSLNELVKHLAPIYNKSIRHLSGLLPSTPALSACAELGVLPFRHKAILVLCNRTIGYLERTKEQGPICFLAEQANLALESVAAVQLPPVAGLHRIGPRSWMAKSPKIDGTIKASFRRKATPERVKAHFYERIEKHYNDYEVRFTDGSKLGDKVGLGILGDQIERCYSLPSACSVFSAEAAAILQATVLPSDKPILIVTDSASALTALESPTNKHPYIQRIQSELEQSEVDVSFMWVPGHSGIAGNGKADALAGTGRNEPLLNRKIPSDDIKTWTKNTVWDAWSREWQRERMLFCRKIKNTTAPWDDLPVRREQIVLSRLRTGHSRMSHDMSGGTDGFRKHCESCGERCTTEHIISHCPALEDLRRIHDITNVIRALQNDPSFERQLINFLKDAQTYNSI